MRAKDKFLEKIKLLIFIFILCFNHNIYAESIYKKIFDYNYNYFNNIYNDILSSKK